MMWQQAEIDRPYCFLHNDTRKPSEIEGCNESPEISLFQSLFRLQVALPLDSTIFIILYFKKEKATHSLYLIDVTLGRNCSNQHLGRDHMVKSHEMDSLGVMSTIAEVTLLHD